VSTRKSQAVHENLLTHPVRRACRHRARAHSSPSPSRASQRTRQAAHEWDRAHGGVAHLPQAAAATLPLHTTLRRPRAHNLQCSVLCRRHDGTWTCQGSGAGEERQKARASHAPLPAPSLYGRARRNCFTGLGCGGGLRSSKRDRLRRPGSAHHSHSGWCDRCGTRSRPEVGDGL
jgi:hypothetical protein